MVEEEMTPLAEELRRLVEREGPLAFSEFVNQALYHPEMGYYSTGKPFRGEGDFYTGPCLHPIFGWTVARYLASLPEPGLLARVLEIGPGKGFLASDILDYLSWRHPDTYEGITYYLLEKSPSLSRDAEGVLSHHRDKVKHLRDLSDIQGFVGVVLANELLDAFGFDRFLRKKNGWVMLAVGPGSPFAWVETEVPQRALELLPPSAPEGLIYDLSLEALDFLGSLARSTERGVILLVDYGYSRDVLLSSHPQGTLTCYYRHTVLDDPFVRVGQQDITYFLDWDLVRRAARGAGLSEVLFATQAEFLMASGIHEILSDMEPSHTALEITKARLAAKNLLLSFKNYRVVVWKKRELRNP